MLNYKAKEKARVVRIRQIGRTTVVGVRAMCVYYKQKDAPLQVRPFARENNMDKAERLLVVRYAKPYYIF